VLYAREAVPDPVGTLLGSLQSRLGDDAGRRDPDPRGPVGQC